MRERLKKQWLASVSKPTPRLQETTKNCSGSASSIFQPRRVNEFRTAIRGIRGIPRRYHQEFIRLERPADSPSAVSSSTVEPWPKTWWPSSWAALKAPAHERPFAQPDLRLGLAEVQALHALDVGEADQDRRVEPLVELVGRGPRAGPWCVQEPVIRPGGDQAVEVPDRREGVAVLLGLAEHRLVPCGTVIEPHGGGVEAAKLLEPLAPGRAVERRIVRLVSIRRPVRASIRKVRSSRLES